MDIRLESDVKDKARSISDQDHGSAQQIDDAESHRGEDEIHKVETTASRASKTSKLSRIIPQLSRIEEVAPIIHPLTDLDRGIIGWESQEDPDMPMNFSGGRKWFCIACLSLITLISPLSSTILSPAINDVSASFHNTDDILAAFPVSIFLLGYAVGPLLLSPLSEIYGRALVLSSANAFFCVWHIGCALAPSLNSLIFFRFMCGVGGAGCMTLGPAVVGDVFQIVERGKGLAALTLGPLIGPTFGPLIGAFIVASLGWRWCLWIVFIPATLVTVALIFVLPETCHKVLIDRKVKRLQRELSRNDLSNCYDIPGAPRQSQLQYILTGLARPLKMLVLAPIILLMSIYVAFMYGTMYLMYNKIPVTFEDQYGFPTSLTGLVYLSQGFGFLVGLWSFSLVSDRLVIYLTKRNNGIYKPEMRLNLIIYYAAIIPITFFVFAWTAYYHVHWIVPVLSFIPFGIGVIGVYLPTQAYIIDAYPTYAASGLAAFIVLRSVIAAFLPLAGPALFASLGLGWGASLLGFICVAFIPIPIFVYACGTYLRTRFPVKL
ncbi:MFS general substrate transporter [Xylariaceae sp. FL1272]|nr:MFS general substrate transporter [Xylariaceae sp. FL1272]